MKFKEGVKVFGIRQEALLILMCAETVWARQGEEVVCTSVVDGSHSVASLHFAGCAVDLRIWGLDVEKAAAELREALTDEYDVVVEADHIHVEYQPKRGQ